MRYWPVSNICQVRSKSQLHGGGCLAPCSSHRQHITHHTRGFASMGVDALAQISKLRPPFHSAVSRFSIAIRSLDVTSSTFGRIDLREKPSWLWKHAWSYLGRGSGISGIRGTGTLLWPYGLLACGVGHSHRGGVRAGPSKAQGPGQEPQLPETDRQDQ